MKLIDLNKLLPADLPAGERVLWHGRPEWTSLARHAFRGDLIAAYFGVMTIWNYISDAQASGWTQALVPAGKTILIGGLALGLICALAMLSAKTTLYVITSRRVVMKIGIALPVFFNIPFAEIASASVRTHADGTGDIPFALTAERRIAYLHLWPHARPLRVSSPEPALRTIPAAAAVAETLRSALLAEQQERTGLASATVREQVATQGLAHVKKTSFPKGVGDLEPGFSK
jgi:hypothetical protein